MQDVMLCALFPFLQLDGGGDDLQVISAIPTAPPPDWDSDTGHLYKYRVTPSTLLVFLARRYKIVFCLDLSPSSAIVVSRL